MDGETVATEMPVASRSSVLLKTYNGVEAKVVSGKLIDEVSDMELSHTGLNGEIDAIGYGWYSMDNCMPPTFSVVGNTYIIKNVEGKFAKVQSEFFYGSNNASFVMDFLYYYKSGE